MSNFDDMKLAVQALSGGKNTVILDDLGMPSIMVIIPQLKSNEVIDGATDTVHPAFIMNGVEQKSVAVSKFQNIVVNNRAYSLPMQDPREKITADAARTYCRNKGEGWGLQPFALWGAVALWCKKNGTMPRGNNNYGSDITYPHEKGVNTYIENGKTARCAAGSGPAAWYHDYTPAGIADLNGNILEWCDGMRLVSGEIQIIPYADCMLGNSDLSESSTEWKAVKADGSLVAPGTSGTLKLDYVSSSWTLCTSITSQDDSNRNSLFRNLKTAGGITVPQILKELALFPADTEGYNSEVFYANNAAEEQFPSRGGVWYSGASAGVFSTHLYRPRSYAGASIGFRSAYYGEM